jgi:hypothetical protein
MFDSAVSSELPSHRASPMQKGIFSYTRGDDGGDGASYIMLQQKAKKRGGKDSITSH